MSDEDLDLHDRETLIEKQLLHTHYEEVSQEFRHRNKLLHNTFYLLIIAVGVFLGLFIRIGLDGNMATLGGLTIVAGIVATLIGHIFLKHFHERTSAEAVRMYIERIASGDRKKVEKPLSLQWGVAGGGVLWVEENERFVRRGSHVHYLTKWPDQVLSAATIGLSLVWLGAGLLVVGIMCLSATITSELITIIIGLVSAVTLILLYRKVRAEACAPDDEPIY